MKKVVILNTLKGINKPISEMYYHLFYKMAEGKQRYFDFEEAKWENNGRFELGPYSDELHGLINDLVTSGNVSRNYKGKIQYKEPSL